MKENFDYEDHQRSKLIKKGRKNQKLKNLFKKINPSTIPQLENDEFESLDYFTKIAAFKK